jgi:hypothetical protein
MSARRAGILSLPIRCGCAEPGSGRYLIARGSAAIRAQSLILCSRLRPKDRPLGDSACAPAQMKVKAGWLSRRAIAPARSSDFTVVPIPRSGTCGSRPGRDRSRQNRLQAHQNEAELPQEFAFGFVRCWRAQQLAARRISSSETSPISVSFRRRTTRSNSTERFLSALRLATCCCRWLRNDSRSFRAQCLSVTIQEKGMFNKRV